MSVSFPYEKVPLFLRFSAVSKKQLPQRPCDFINHSNCLAVIFKKKGQGKATLPSRN